MHGSSQFEKRGALIAAVLLSISFVPACSSQASPQGQPFADGGSPRDAASSLDSGNANGATDSGGTGQSGGDAALVGSGVDAGPCGPALLVSAGYQGGSAPSFPPLVFSSAFANCTSSSDCGCGLTCTDDPFLQSTYFDDSPLVSEAGFRGWCEQPCATTSDCADPATVCRNNACTWNVCGMALDGGAAPGSFGQSCDADGNPGTCQIVYEDDNYGVLMGVCLQSGSATGSCRFGAPRTQSTEICAQGSLCLGNSFQGCSLDGGSFPLHAMPDPFCEPVCDLNQNPNCRAGMTCVPWEPESVMGLCAPSTLTFGTCR